MTREQLTPMLETAGFKPSNNNTWKRHEHNGISIYLTILEDGKCKLSFFHYNAHDCTTTDVHPIDEAVQILKDVYVL